MREAHFWLPEKTILDGRYELEKVLGVGGYGITYRAIDTRLLRPVAVKEFYPSFWASRFAQMGPQVHCLDGADGDFARGMERFILEARNLAQLGNIPGVVRVENVFNENNTAYLVMEFLDGKNLKQMVDGFGGRIPPEVLIPVLAPVVKALGQVHKTGLIHRDISPDNIMMLEDGSVRLIDFGNARDASNGKSMTLAMKEGFAPPEQYRSKGQGPWTDVYGLCATIYYCLTGKLPPQPMDRLTGTALVRPSEMGVAIPAWQESVILDGLDLFVDRRIHDMDELWQRLYGSENQTDGKTNHEAKTNNPLHSGLQRFQDVCSQIYRKIKL